MAADRGTGTYRLLSGMCKGIIFDIQKFSIHDGPGIRTTVFFKGCPLDCRWCHNPESKEREPELSYNGEKCLHCGRCVTKCPRRCHEMRDGRHILDRRACTRCGLCTGTGCPALEMAGRSTTPEAALEEIMKDKVFYDNSGGGLTVSGGEPLFQFEFIYRLLTLAKEQKLHVCMETSGFAPVEHFKAVAELVDLFLFDYKETDPVKHKEYTGVDNRLILQNLKALDNLGAGIILRCPIIPGIIDREEHFKGIAETANGLKNAREIQIEPYHPLGESKCVNLGKRYGLPGRGFPEASLIPEWIAAIQAGTGIAVGKA
jgi:pyruvate formate lyase activating enzyme